MNTPLIYFHADTGLYPFRVCSAAEVRSIGLYEPTGFAHVLEFAWNLGAWWGGTPQNPACEFCYAYPFFLDIDAYNPDDNIIEACLAPGGPTDLCLNTTMMIKARETFYQCAGYDILTSGNMCTAEGVATVESLIPAPYYTFAQCAYDPETPSPFCSTIQAYLDEIEADTNSVDCLACYTKLQSDLITLAADDSDEVCGTDVFSDDCIAYQIDALAAFETCSGYTLNAISATAAPSVSTTAAPVEDATEASTNAATTTVASTTTKAGSHLAITMLVSAALAMVI